MRVRFQKILISATRVAVFASALAGAAQVSQLFDTPTALGPLRGEYNFRFTAYEGGGLGVQGQIGIIPQLSLGIVQYFDGLIGSNISPWDIPGVLGKFTFLGNPPEGWNVAVGYGPLYQGSFRNGKRHPYGPYAVATKGFMLLAPLPHLFNFGAYYALVPDVGRFTAFASLLVDFTQNVSYGVELTGLTFASDSNWDLINNHTINLSVNENIGFQLVFQIATKFHTEGPMPAYFDTRTSRNLGINVQSFF